MYLCTMNVFFHAGKRGRTENGCDLLLAGSRYRIYSRRVAKKIRRQRRASEEESPWRKAGNFNCDLVTSSHSDGIANWRD